MIELSIKDEFIKLGQALKLIGFVDSGIDAKIEIIDGNVKVNGVTEYQRGKKLREGDQVEFNGQYFQIKSNLIKE